ncbi:MAG: class I SAM-dependent methyltransferase [Bacteroidales bacterium]|nr:class I SAM-dependent methyltransferase [Bacteroidales bacterium]
MQKRHKDRRLYFNELANTSRDFYLDYVRTVMPLDGNTRVLEIGCGEGGNLLPFAEMGCKVTGIDIDKPRIDNAIKFFGEEGQKGEFIASDFLEVPVPQTEEERFDLVLVHDVIEHIEAPYKHSFMQLMQRFMKRSAVAFFGFPAWQMPFGGHQQMCHGRLSKMPYIHLLPTKMYGSLLKHAGETESSVEGLMSIKRSRMPIEKFERLVRESGMRVCKRTLWLINPHYKQKFHLVPVREVWPFNAIPWLRNFYSTSAWYLLKNGTTET